MSTVFYCEKCNKLLVEWWEAEQQISSYKYKFDNNNKRIEAQCIEVSDSVEFTEDILYCTCPDCFSKLSQWFELPDEHLNKIMNSLVDGLGYFKDSGIVTTIPEGKTELTDKDIDLILFEMNLIK